MLRVGLTGGIASGKSTVAERLVRLGALLIDADVIAREVVGPGTPGFDAVVEEFGRNVVLPDGTLDRPALGKIVFADVARREALNAIVHPLVYQRRTDLAAQAPDDAVVVEDVPLLVENRLGSAYHLVIVVDAEPDERVRRLMEGRGMTADEAWGRIHAQAGDEARRAAADVWLDNSGTADELLRQVDDLWRDRIVPFEKNVRTRTVAPLPSVLPLVPYGDTWTQQADRLIARIAAAAGDLVARVDHIGDTVAAGGPARDVIDLRVVANSPGSEPQLGEALDDAGFPRDSGTEGARGAADPGRPVRIYVQWPS